MSDGTPERTMPDNPGPDIRGQRLDTATLEDNFGDLHPLLSRHEAFVEADRCYFCFDAQCTIACPTSIDIPLFIRQIQADNATGAAKTIFDQNILGGMCARVCPVETLCEQACVRNLAEDKPVTIGQLQRYATDRLVDDAPHPYERAALSGKNVGIVGAGPAGLSCAHRLALHGHDVTIYEARSKPGGLNEFGIAAYKTVDDFAQAEVGFVTAIGGIEIKYDTALGRDMSLADLRARHDAVFVGVGLGAVNQLGLADEDASGSIDAVEWIADLRQASDLAGVAVGRRIVVIGGGMTAVDAAVQSKLLGADQVTIAYRRGKDRLNASEFEQELAQTSGVTIRLHLQPKALVTRDGAVVGIDTGETEVLAADMVFKAIGQTFVPAALDGGDTPVALENGRIRVDGFRRTSVADVWAGGDCISDGDDLTVIAVEDGKIAAESIHRVLAS
ncbi:MAG: NAD(P)-dependent oxidoreductase [Alphaproteobacteria bacterium]